MADSEVENWKKRLRRKAPFYLLETNDIIVTRWDHSVSPFVKFEVPAKSYTVIWNDGPKTKYGSLSDYMSCRYGIRTWSVLNGETVYDLWNGSGLDDSIFNEMLKVRNDTSSLPHFDFDQLVGLTH